MTVGLLAFAMGARNDSISRLSVQTNLTTTVLTSALTGLASDFALGRLHPPGQPAADLAVPAARRRAPTDDPHGRSFTPSSRKAPHRAAAGRYIRLRHGEIVAGATGAQINTTAENPPVLTGQVL